MQLIKINDVSYTYKQKGREGFLALKNVSLDINEGEFLAIVGKTGSGKSTLIQCLNGLLLPTNGFVQYEDYIVTGDKKLKKEKLKDKDRKIKKLNKRYSNLKKDIGIVFQFPEKQLFSETILKDVMFGPLNFGYSKEDAEKQSKEALIAVGLDETYFNKSPFELSGGEKRRAAIAGIISFKPKILILDEPTAGLDAKGKKEIMNYVKALSDSGTTIIFVTHDMDVVLNYASRVVVLDKGEIVKDTNPKDLFNSGNLKEYSLEEPLIYKLKKELLINNFKGDLDSIFDIDSLIDEYLRSKNG